MTCNQQRSQPHNLLLIAMLKRARARLFLLPHDKDLLFAVN
ncbi:hypothetical protein Z949_3416 [Sulfitobacter guttiformis KCTC 32187]|nr:hypothetical protein Z949_3416 [Sulfitobacter guttiformis KCTC 32187]